jgi:hypothetical protein
MGKNMQKLIYTRNETNAQVEQMIRFIFVVLNSDICEIYILFTRNKYFLFKFQKE